VQLSVSFLFEITIVAIVKEVIARQLKVGSQLVIALDRTQWKEYNVLMVSAIAQKRAFPIFWTLLDKHGASNVVEQQQVLRPVIRLLKRYKLVIVGDREFHSIELAQGLHCQHLSFVLRQKRSTTFREKRQPFQSLDSIPVQARNSSILSESRIYSKKRVF
jgi:hypothetical protein